MFLENNLSGMTFSHSSGWEVLGGGMMYRYSLSKVKSKQERKKKLKIVVSVVVAILGVLRATINLCYMICL